MNTADHFYVKYPSSLGQCNKYIECIQDDTLFAIAMNEKFTFNWPN